MNKRTFYNIASVFLMVMILQSGLIFYSWSMAFRGSVSIQLVPILVAMNMAIFLLDRKILTKLKQVDAVEKSSKVPQENQPILVPPLSPSFSSVLSETPEVIPRNDPGGKGEAENDSAASSYR